MENIIINMAGLDLTFAVNVLEDCDDSDAPWDNSDFHGPVSCWTTRSKKPGEIILKAEGHYVRYYDFQEACKIALRDGWYEHHYNDGTETKRQQATKAAMADYEYLRSWCNDEWHYVGVEVTLLDSQGNKTDVSDSIWGIENRGDEVKVQANTIAEELAHGLYTRFEMITETVTTFKMID